MAGSYLDSARLYAKQTAVVMLAMLRSPHSALKAQSMANHVSSYNVSHQLEDLFEDDRLSCGPASTGAPALSLAAGPSASDDIRITLLQFQSTVAKYLDVSKWGWSLNASTPCQPGADAAWLYVLCASGHPYGLNLTAALDGAPIRHMSNPRRPSCSACHLQQLLFVK